MKIIKNGKQFIHQYVVKIVFVLYVQTYMYMYNANRFGSSGWKIKFKYLYMYDHRTTWDDIIYNNEMQEY